MSSISNAAQMVSMSTVARMVPARDAQPLLAEQEHIVPEPRLEVALELGQVVVGPEGRTAPPLQRRTPGVEQVQPEVEQAGRDRLTVDQQVPLGEVPAARPDHQRARLGIQANSACLPGW